MSKKHGGKGGPLAAAAAEVEAGRGPVAVTRPGHKPVVLISAEQWQRLTAPESSEPTAWWQDNAAGHAVPDEEPWARKEGSRLDEAGLRRRFAHLFRDAGAA